MQDYPEIRDDEDLSGCLAKQPHGTRLKVSDRAVSNQLLKDEDLSGCLTSGFLKPKQTVAKTSQNFVPIDRSKLKKLETDKDNGSDWFNGRSSRN